LFEQISNFVTKFDESDKEEVRDMITTMLRSSGNVFHESKGLQALAWEKHFPNSRLPIFVVKRSPTPEVSEWRKEIAKLMEALARVRCLSLIGLLSVDRIEDYIENPNEVEGLARITRIVNEVVPDDTLNEVPSDLTEISLPIEVGAVPDTQIHEVPEMVVMPNPILHGPADDQGATSEMSSH
jgi:hypothetical protein